MPKTPDKNILRAIPSVDSLLADARVIELRDQHPHFPWTRLFRIVIDEFRTAYETGQEQKSADRDSVRDRIIGGIIALFSRLQSGGQCRVINGTGVILHTNLGRAILGARLQQAVSTAMSHYVSLEFDLTSGERSKRGQTMLDLISLASGAEEAMVVNNNAAALYLVVNSCSPPGRVIVSRGELVEIGGSFRLPDILSRAAGEVVEVGTTNRTYAADYDKAAQPGDLILKVHQSNYEVTGFTHEAAIAELVDVARKKRCFLAYDLGSGAMFDFAKAAIGGEDVVSKIMQSGVDCVTLSGDKLLGGVQAGIIVGSAIFLARLKQNPLRRALRVDKITIAALEALYRCYLFAEQPEAEITVLRQAMDSVQELQARAGRIVSELPPKTAAIRCIEVVDDEAAMGGGSFACEKVPSCAIAIRCASEKEAVLLSRRMRSHAVPIISRIKGNEVRINMRSVLPQEDNELTECLAALVEEKS
ncbi:MAG: L-seryl-tRNA(Sec) selenium transferase [Candidatus Latescibacterota bacterium]